MHTTTIIVGVSKNIWDGGTITYRPMLTIKVRGTRIYALHATLDYLNKKDALAYAKTTSREAKEGGGIDNTVWQSSN